MWQNNKRKNKKMKNIKFLLAIATLIFAMTLIASAQENQFLVSLDGQKIDVSSQDKVVVLAIGASWLPLSKNQVSAVNKLSKKYAGRDVVFYFISTDSENAKSKNYASNDQLRKFATDNKLTVGILRDSDGTLTVKKYKIDQFPAFVILKKDGLPAAEVFGGIDPTSDITVPLSELIDKAIN